MQSHVTKWGNSLGIRIPLSLAKEIGLGEGTQVDIRVENDTIIIHKKKYSLEALLSQVTPENIHGEVGTGPSVGREAW